MIECHVIEKVSTGGVICGKLVRTCGGEVEQGDLLVEYIVVMTHHTRKMPLDLKIGPNRQVQYPRRGKSDRNCPKKMATMALA